MSYEDDCAIVGPEACEEALDAQGFTENDKAKKKLSITETFNNYYL